MPVSISHTIPSCSTHSFLDELHTFGVQVKDACQETAQKIKELLFTRVFQGILGFGIGLGLYKIYEPLTQKILKGCGTCLAVNPFNSLSLGLKIIFSPFICVIGPIFEEVWFRGDLQGTLKEKFESFYQKCGLSDRFINIASRITAVFFASIIFGLVHFSNALVFWCNPVLFLPQVVAAALMGILFGIAKEITGDLFLSSGMHIGNNTLAWFQEIQGSFK
jgi:membrane protease YdiL (CAAX protease family)